MSNSKKLLAFGDASEGQIPISIARSDIACINVPHEINCIPTNAAGENIRAISSGEKHTLFLTEDGVIYSVGGNDYGQLGRITTNSSGNCELSREADGCRLFCINVFKSSFAIRPISLSGGVKFVQLSCGQSHNLAVADDGRVFAWGSNEFLQCGAESNVKIVEKPARIRVLLDVVSCNCGPSSSIVLLEHNRVYIFGQFCETALYPTEIQLLSFYHIVQVVAGAQHFSVLTAAGQVLCWGKDYFGVSTDSSDNQNGDLFIPQVIELTKDLKVAYICCGFNHTILLTANGRVFGFGSDAFGQLGGGKRETRQSFPQPIAELLGTHIISIACGRLHTVCLAQNGRIYTFGQNSSGQLGLGTFTKRLTPAIVDSKLDELEVVDIFAGWDQTFVCAYTLPKRKKIISPLRLLKQPKVLTFDRIRNFVGSRKKLELIADLECVFSTLGGLNGSFYYEDDRRLECSERNHGINLDEVMYGLNSLENMGPTDAKNFSEIIQEKIQSSGYLNEMTSIITKGHVNLEMIKFILILPWINQMIQPDNNFIFSVFLPFVNLLNRLPKQLTSTLIHWWSQLAIRHFNRIVQSLMIGLEFLFKKHHEQYHYFRPILNILQILNKINRNANKISYDHFYLNSLEEHKDIVMRDYAYHYLRQRPEVSGSIPHSEFHWAEYPFIMNATLKSAILEVDSQIKMHIKMQQNRSFVVFPLQFIEIPYLIFHIRRANIVEDTYQNLFKYRDDDYQKPLRVIFDGEEGEDAGGVRPDFGMFVEDELSHLIWPSGIEGDLDNYGIVGRLAALAIYNSVLVDFPFPLALYKYLLDYNFTLDDLKELHPTEGKSLEDILDYEDNDFEDVFMLNFVINITSFGHSVEVELKDNGRNIQVTKSNRNEFVSSYIEVRLRKGLNGEVEKQLHKFKEGFTKVLETRILEFFQPRELMELVSGNENYDWEAFKENCQYKGVYNKSHGTIKAFWEAFFELDFEQRKKFLKFVSGSDRIPLTGMKDVKLTIQPIPEKLLPVAHTCFNLLDLPDIKNKNELYRRILICLDHAQGFSLV